MSNSFTGLQRLGGAEDTENRDGSRMDQDKLKAQRTPFDYVLHIPTANVPMKPVRNLHSQWVLDVHVGYGKAEFLLAYPMGGSGVARSVRALACRFAMLLNSHLMLVYYKD